MIRKNERNEQNDRGGIETDVSKHDTHDKSTSRRSMIQGYGDTV